MIVDTHAHILRHTYGDDYDKVVELLLSNNELKVINVSLDKSTLSESLELCKKHPHKFKTTIGIHPTHNLDNVDKDIEYFKKIYSLNKAHIIAVGETGLNRYDSESIESQKHSFQEHIKLALELKLPLIIHSRNTDKETYDILSKYDNLPKIVIHSWTGSLEYTKLFLSLGVFLSYSGIATFKNALSVQENLVNTPANRIFYETDSPWLSPEPFRGKQNNPIMSKYVAEKICHLKDISKSTLDKSIEENFYNVFKTREWLFES